MRTGIDIKSTLKRKTGIGYYTFNLISHLAKIDTTNNYFLYSCIKFFSHKKKLPLLPGANFSHRVNRFNLPLDLVIGGVDVFHTSSYNISPPKNSKLVLTVHDVIHKAYPRGHSRETREEIDKNLKRILKKADMLIAVSETTKTDILKWYSVSAEKIKVIYSGVNQQINQIEKSSSLFNRLKEKYNISDRFLLFVGTIEPRKNIEGLIRAYQILKTEHNLPHQLVVVGMKGWMYSGVFELVKTYGLENKVIFTDYIPSESQDLNLLYNFAEIFIYPSFYEGFGFPIIEAFKCGIPVIASNISSCAEIAGNAAILINPNNSDEIVKAVLKIINDPNLRNQLKLKGLTRSGFFSWEKAARKTLEVFEEVCSG